MKYQPCAQCGTQFKVYPSEEGRAKYCSKRCQADQRRGKPMPWKAGRRVGYRVPNLNTYRTEGDVSFIRMSNGVEAVVDTADLPLLQSYRWTAFYSKDIAHWYALTSVPRPDGKGSRNLFMHRLLMKTPKGMVTDHINHNSLDNRRANLRVCTNSENMYNRKDCDPRSRTGIQGVSLQTTVEGQRYYLARVTVTKLFPVTDDGLRDAAAFVKDARSKLGVQEYVNAT